MLCNRILKVARTIVDLAASPNIQTEYVSEAIQPVLSDLSAIVPTSRRVGTTEEALSPSRGALAWA